MRKLTKEEFEKYIKDAAEYKFRQNPAFFTKEFYEANKEYFDEIGIVGVFEGEPITEEEVIRGHRMTETECLIFEDYRAHDTDEINKVILPLLNIPKEDNE